MEFVAYSAAIAFAIKITGLVKFVTAGDWNKTLTQIVAWGAGVLVAWLLAASDFGAGVVINDIPLSSFNFASLVLFGVGLASSGSVVYDFKKSFDNTDSASEPPLLRS